jgi:large subunit ribosomal protein L15
MKLHTLKSTMGSRRDEVRVGRGAGSGIGGLSRRGQNGQNSRTGGGVRPGFEGGQNPIYRRLSKRGFIHSNKTVYAIVNLETLNKFENGAEVNPTKLKEAGIVRQEHDGIKILGTGKLTKKLNVKAHKFSKTAQQAITAAGGTVEVI